MAREYARVKVAIWADGDFRDLADPAQALYFRLISSPTMSLCGVADWRPKRLAALTRGQTEETVREAADELVERGYIVVDEDTEEVLVRSFVRHDGLIKTPNIAASMVKDYAGTASRTLRGVIVYELNRLHTEDPQMKGWVTASELLSHEQINPSKMALTMPSSKASGNGSHIPHPSSSNQQPSSPGDANASPAPDRLDVIRLCNHLADRIEGNGIKRPDIGKTWHVAARLLIDKDGYTEQQIHWLIDRALTDEFWRANILSMPTLRKQADRLKLKFHGQAAVGTQPDGSWVDDRGIRRLPDGTVDESTLPPVEESWMRRRPTR